MLSQIDVSRLDRWAHRDLPKSPIEKARLSLQYSAVYWYNFHDPLHGKDELHKIRPIAILNRNPSRRLADKLALHGVPFSTSLRDNGDITVELNGKQSRGLATHATTLNSDRLLEYIRTLTPAEMDGLTSALVKQLHAQPATTPRQPLDPGNVYQVPWHTRDQMRNMLILTDAHQIRSGVPTMMMPVESISSAEKGTDTPKPRPVSLERVLGPDSALVGKISLGALKRNQAHVRAVFDLG